MSAAERQFFIYAARDWLGTPFHYGARLYGEGVDCAQLIVAAGLASGLLLEEPPESRKMPNLLMPRFIRSILENYLVEIPLGTEQPGDIYWLRTRRNLPLHLAIVTTKGVLHASYEAGKVVETSLPHELKARIAAVWKFKSLSNE